MTPDQQSRRNVVGWGVVTVLVALVTFSHYSTAVHIHEAHGIYRRLYYFPIVIGAFLGGWRGGVGTALAVCAFYLPHAFGYIGFDPAPTLEKVLEMVLYLAIGLLTGTQVGRLRRVADSLAKTLREKDALEADLVRTARLAAVGRLSAGLAHEIRNPLASITASADILADDVDPDDPKGRLVTILRDESARLDGVLTRFLDFARPRERNGELCVLADEVARVAALVDGVETDDARDRSITVFADRDQLRQILLNVMLNARHFSRGVVRVSLDRDAEVTTCRIADDGPGFSPEALSQFGTPFYSTREGGTGLGLALSLRLAEDNGGRLEAAAGPAGGAVVTLILPEAERGDDGARAGGR